MERTLIAMSGGVDSSVAAYLINQQGAQCIGATMLLWSSADQDPAADARQVAGKLGMEFYVFDHHTDFCMQVVEKFIDAYEAGDTPNPCICCNRHLKFDILLQKALSLGCSKLATGHYAQVSQDPATGRYLLSKAADPGKDQTYFLACLTQQQLSHCIFPLGGLTKAQVRQIAETQGFTNANKRDSQDICFIPDGDYVSFMENYRRKTYAPGNYLDMCGNVVGTHRGAVCYTIGQRKGLGLAMGAPVYVCSKNMQNNTVTVGPNEALYRSTLRATDWNWILFPALSEPIRVTAKVRYRHNPQPATVYPEADGCARVEFDEPQRAITPGQAVVLYDGDMVVGSATITKVL